jgi:hypothetical protein
MSLQTFIKTVEADVGEAVTWVEGETDTALSAIWGVAKPIFVAFEPTLVSGVLAAVTTFLGTAGADVQNGGLDDIEQAFIENLETLGSTLVKDAQSLGSNVLQALIGLAKEAAAKA